MRYIHIVLRTANAVILATGLLLLGGCAEKPVLELFDVEEALAAAADVEADIYAPEEFNLAVMNLESGQHAIEDEEARAAWSRNYELAVDYLFMAYEQAIQAEAIATANKEEIFEQAQASLPIAERTMDAAFEAVERLRTRPVSIRDLQALDDELAAAFVNLNRGRAALENGSYQDAATILQQVRETAAAAELRARQIAELLGPPS